MMTYTTVQGDMWDAIAYTQLGSCAYTDRLMNANQHYHDVYIFSAGVELVLPDISQAPVSTLPPWKQVTA